MAYVTYQEIIAATPDVEWHQDSYDFLNAMIARAGELIDRLTRRYVPGAEAYAAAATASTRIYTASGGCQVRIDDCIAVSGVEIRTGSETAWTTLAATDYVTYPYNALPIFRLDIDERQGTYARWPVGYPQNVRVTARWGYSATAPEVVKQAAVIQVIRWYRRGGQLFNDVSPIGELGGAQFTTQLDPEVITLLMKSGLIQRRDLF